VHDGGCGVYDPMKRSGRLSRSYPVLGLLVVVRGMKEGRDNLID
jgi:hypothetical protein